MNALSESNNPYLLQHAHNPVEWYPWGEEAIARAKAEGKPILLSVGYSTCFWCHVMEREVFENASIAAIMNEHFINIKLDREEHPDLDETYMIARQMMTSEGGWPNNVFLTPDLKPFFAGGTYGATEHYGKPPFPGLLRWIHDAWMNKREEIEAQAEKVTQAIRQHLHHASEPAELDEEAFPHAAFSQLSQVYDPQSGGFHRAPKFPHETYLFYLLYYHRVTKSARALEIATHTLHRMAAGGLYDHVGAGFHRYSVDKDWLVPHFEKMLYNQALLARAYTEHHTLTGDPYTADIGKSVLDFVCGPFSDSAGGFYTAIDAETDGVEGAYYIWSAKELEDTLGTPQLNFLADMYTLSELPYFTGHKAPTGRVLSATLPLPEAADKRGKSYLEAMAHSARVFNVLLEARNKRLPPRLDNKILTGMNGLMITAFAQGGRVFGKERYTKRAEAAAEFVLSHCKVEGVLTHGFTSGETALPALLEDYAYFIQGLLALGGTRWRAEAGRLMQEANARLWKTDANAFAASADDATRIIPMFTVEDGALPSPNAVMLHNLLDLGWNEQAGKLAGAFSSHVGDAGTLLEHCTYLSARMRMHEAQIKDSTPDGAPRRTTSDDILQFTAQKIGADEIILTLDIAEGWHIQPATVTEPYQKPTRFEIAGAADAHFDFPEPVARRFAFMEKPIAVYEGKVVVRARVKLPEHKAEGGYEPLKVQLSCQPCNHEACFPPIYRYVNL